MIRWGVAGPGDIARSFAQAMTRVTDGTISAVASRSLERATAFGEEFGIPRAYGDYSDLAADPEIEAVYVATPQSRHEADALMFLEAGKGVLCEKPLALNESQARRMAEEARRRGLFLMEAIWSRFLPAYRAMTEAIDAGGIGEPLLIESDFGFRVPVQPEHRLFNLELGGGAILDLGIYPVQLCSLVLGPVEQVAAAGYVGETGVDEQSGAVLLHGEGKLGVIKSAIRTPMSCTARISGTDGWIDLPAFMHCPDYITISGQGSSERLDCSFEGHGLQFEIVEVNRCLAEGRTESAVMPLDESIALASILDQIRVQVGVHYPGE
jgi:predicted dehydrogenase